MISTSSAGVTPFLVATAVRPLGDGTFAVELAADWTVGGKPHGGYLMALTARAAAEALEKGRPADPLAVAMTFVRVPGVGPALVRTEIVKTGRTVSTVRVELVQRGEICATGTITLGALTEDEPVWSDLPELAAEPPARAIDVGATEAATTFRLSRACRLMLDPEGAAFLTAGTTAPLRLRLWVRPHDLLPDPFFLLVVGDISMPVTFNLGRLSWAPTVQLTSLIRTRPSSGWLRLSVDSRSVAGPWFDEDATVLDSAGRLVCQSRQLALTTPA